MNCKNVGPIVEDESKATLRELAGPSSKTTTSWTAAYARNAPMVQTRTLDRQSQDDTEEDGPHDGQVEARRGHRERTRERADERQGDHAADWREHGREEDEAQGAKEQSERAEQHRQD